MFRRNVATAQQRPGQNKSSTQSPGWRQDASTNTRWAHDQCSGASWKKSIRVFSCQGATEKAKLSWQSRCHPSHDIGASVYVATITMYGYAMYFLVLLSKYCKCLPFLSTGVVDLLKAVKKIQRDDRVVSCRFRLIWKISILFASIKVHSRSPV